MFYQNNLFEYEIISSAALYAASWHLGRLSSYVHRVPSASNFEVGAAFVLVTTMPYALQVAAKYLFKAELANDQKWPVAVRVAALGLCIATLFWWMNPALATELAWIHGVTALSTMAIEVIANQCEFIAETA